MKDLGKTKNSIQAMNSNLIKSIYKLESEEIKISPTLQKIQADKIAAEHSSLNY